jgi:hypothetical protein
MLVIALRFLAILLTGLAVVAPAAHLFELPHKIVMAENQYFVVQGIYRGWWMIGLALPTALIANLALAIATRQDRATLMLTLFAAGLLALNLAIFFGWTNPANTATSNWTMRPENWRVLRAQWEYSHAINAGVTLLAFCCATAAGVCGSS